MDEWILTKDSDWGEGYSSAEFKLNSAGSPFQKNCQSDLKLIRFDIKILKWQEQREFCQGTYPQEYLMMAEQKKQVIFI